MSNFQNKVLRLFTGQNTNADWHPRSGGYSKDEVANIKDPAAGSRKEITSIPSPFARIHLFENAFEWVANHAKTEGNNTLTKKTAYHQLVSDALDVAEVFFNFEVFNQTQKNLRFVVWNKKNELANLKNSPKHRLFGETLELYLSQDNVKTHFDLVDNVYLLFCDDILVGGTSPSTLFFAAHNEGFRLARLSLNRGNDVFFDEEPNPLYNRSMALQRYLYGLFTVNLDLRQIMAPLWRYMSVSLDVLKTVRPNDYAAIQAIIDNRSYQGQFQGKPFNAEAFISEFSAATTGETNAFVDVLKNIHHRRLKGGPADYATDDFAIKSIKYGKSPCPLVLQNNFTKALSYCGGTWKPDILVPFQDPQ